MIPVCNFLKKTKTLEMGNKFVAEMGGVTPGISFMPMEQFYILIVEIVTQSYTQDKSA